MEIMSPVGLSVGMRLLPRPSAEGLLAITLQLPSPVYGVEEDLEAVAVLFCALPCPVGVLGAPNMPLGVGHKGKDTPGAIADTGNIE
jgi:hypothetical protein